MKVNPVTGKVMTNEQVNRYLTMILGSPEGDCLGYRFAWCCKTSIFLISISGGTHIDPGEFQICGRVVCQHSQPVVYETAISFHAVETSLYKTRMIRC